MLSVQLHARLIKALICVMLAAAPICSAANTCGELENEGTLIILGASYAKEWPLATLNGYRVVNRGVGGNESFEMAARFQTDVLDPEPDAVIVWGFINDIFRSAPGTMEITKDRIKRSYEDMIVRAEENNIEVILATEVTLAEPAGMMNWAAGVVGRLLGKTSYQDRINEHVMEINKWLVEHSASRNIRTLDFQSTLADSDSRRKSEYATDDGSHLTPAAYDALSAYVTEKLQWPCANE